MQAEQRTLERTRPNLKEIYGWEGPVRGSGSSGNAIPYAQVRFIIISFYSH